MLRPTLVYHAGELCSHDADLRTHGKPPFTIAVVHGGPGARGEMAPVARELASTWSVLEPLQTAITVCSQVDELKAVLDRYASPPVTLIGFSWGAWLSSILAARHPALVSKLVLVSSGPFEETYAAQVQQTRLARLSEHERAEVESLLDALDRPTAGDQSSALSRLGALLSKADAFDPIGDPAKEGEVRANVFRVVWSEAAELRKSGRLLALARKLQCPVVAIHGDYDPHPAEGVQVPLSAALKDFRFVLLQHCGHKPWMERQAKDTFYAALRQALAPAP